MGRHRDQDLANIKFLLYPPGVQYDGHPLIKVSANVGDTIQEMSSTYMEEVMRTSLNFYLSLSPLIETKMNFYLPEPA